MKVQLETISSNRSFTMMFNPKLNDLFFWHFHPEYELVYIEGASGTRHVGNHISSFTSCDLVLIGSNIPHLNFDYGIKSDYKKVVVHLKKDLIESHFQHIPELLSLVHLFDKAKKGIAFEGKIKTEIGNLLFSLENLSPIFQFMRLLEILEHLSTVQSYELLHEQPFDNKYSEREQGRLRMIYAFIDQHYHHKIELNEVAEISHMTKEAFCRYFKKATQYTFIEFLNRYRVSQSKRYLMAGKSVSDACYNSGFESLSYYNRVFKKITQENPSEFRHRYL